MPLKIEKKRNKQELGLDIFELKRELGKQLYLNIENNNNQ